MSFKKKKIEKVSQILILIILNNNTNFELEINKI